MKKVIEGVEYVDVKQAHQISGLVPEYLRRLARNNKVQSRKDGVVWISEPSLRAYMTKMEELGHQKFSAKRIAQIN